MTARRGSSPSGSTTSPAPWPSRWSGPRRQAGRSELGGPDVVTWNDFWARLKKAARPATTVRSTSPSRVMRAQATLLEKLPDPAAHPRPAADAPGRRQRRHGRGCGGRARAPARARWTSSFAVSPEAGIVVVKSIVLPVVQLFSTDPLEVEHVSSREDRAADPGRHLEVRPGALDRRLRRQAPRSSPRSAASSPSSRRRSSAARSRRSPVWSGGRASSSRTGICTATFIPRLLRRRALPGASLRVEQRPPQRRQRHQPTPSSPSRA